MATADGDLVPFQDVRVSRSTAPALLCGIGEKSVWLLRWHISGKLLVHRRSRHAFHPAGGLPVSRG
jgi:hypothetical protein